MNRSLITLPVALVFTALTVATATPAFAKADNCVTAPAALRAAAAGAAGDVAKRALAQVATGEKLCEAGNDLAASRKFKVAAKLVNVDYTALTTPAAAAK